MTETIPPASTSAAVDVTCMFGLGFASPQGNSAEELALAIIAPVREVPGGIEVPFAAESEDAVRRYVDAESRRRPDLAFTVRAGADAVILSVTERLGG